MRTRIARSTLGWAYGLAISVLFLSLWGRSVVSDTDTLADSLSPLAASSFVVDYVTGWMTEEMVEGGVDQAIADPAAEHLLGSSAVSQALDQVGAEVVDAAASNDPAGSTVDMAGLLAPAVPEVATGLSVLGLNVSVEAVADIVSQFDPLVIRAPASEAMVGPASPTAARLGTAALLAVVAMVLFGAGFLWVSDDRIAALRSLMTRVAVGGLSFSIFLRLSSWVLDPEGGRAPVRESMSALASSKWALPLQVGFVAALIAGGIYAGRRLIRREEASQSPVGQPTPSRERPPSRSESR